MARRILAGAFLVLVMTLSFASVASAQSDSNSNSNSNTNTNSSTSSSSSKTAGATTARTGAEMWIPLMLGGLVITVAVATRVGLSRAASRIP
jgi:hypothetical protein